MKSIQGDILTIIILKSFGIEYGKSIVLHLPENHNHCSGALAMVEFLLEIKSSSSRGGCLQSNKNLSNKKKINVNKNGEDD